MSKQDQKTQILNGARAMFLAHGARGFSMRGLAVSLGVTPGALYWHFKNKEELVGEIFMEGVETFSRYISLALTGSDPLDRLKLCSEAFLAFGLEQPSHYDVFFLSRTPPVDHNMAERFSLLRRGTFQILVDRVRECCAEKIFRQDVDVDRVAIMLLSSAQGLMTMYRQGQLGQNQEHFEQIYRNTFEVMKNLLLA